MFSQEVVNSSILICNNQSFNSPFIFIAKRFCFTSPLTTTRFQYKTNTIVKRLYGPELFDYVAISVNTFFDALILAVGFVGRMNIIKGVVMIGLFAGKCGHRDEFRKW